MTYDEMIAVIAAKRDGREVQRQFVAAERQEVWVEMIDGEQFDFVAYRYRIAPEPLTVWVPVYKDGTTGGTYMSECHARKSADGLAVDRIVKFVEVTE